jgi:hypothetical protein
LNIFKSFANQLNTVNAETFDEIALQLFQVQSVHNTVYARFIEALGIHPRTITSVESIPFLPIRFFKQHVLKSGDWSEQQFFASSGTTGLQTSRHAVYNTSAYLQHAQRIFEKQFGPLSEYHLLALLPSYLEQGQSSLVSMIDYFIKETQSPYSGFYRHNTEKLVADVEQLKAGADRKVIVWGVTYALMDVAEKFELDWSAVMVFETGGMKGRRKEITREALHQQLMNSMGVDRVFSEYGMTELFSQAYTSGGNRYIPAHTMKVVIRDLTDPFRKGLLKETGGINVIDLANYSTVAFIETEDIGKLSENGGFEVMGRMDNSDVRGCNLLVE